MSAQTANAGAVDQGLALDASLLDSLDIEAPQPPAKPCFRRISCGIPTWDRMLWVSQLVLSLVGFGMALLSVFTDISTIYAYFSNGNKAWGIVTAVFTGLGWGLFVLLGVVALFFDVGHDEVLASDFLKRLPSAVLGVLTILQLLPALFQLDASTALWQHRHDKSKREYAVRDTAFALDIFKSIESILKTAPLLILHTYILLINQLGAGYIGKRYTGLDRLSQVGSIASGVYFLAPSYVSYVFSGERSWLNKHDVVRSWRKQFLIVFFAVDSAVRVFRIAILSSCVHGWAAVAVGAAVSLLALFASCARSTRAALFAVSSPISCFVMFKGKDLLSPVPIALDTLCTIVMLAVPFALPARPYVHLHGVCSSLSDVNAGANCFPLPLVASVAALVLLHWVLFGVVLCFPRKQAPTVRASNEG